MRTLLIALASALLLAALVTEIAPRFWPGDELALLITTFLALLVNGLFNARLKQSPTHATDKGQRRERPAQPKRGKDKEPAGKGPRDAGKSAGRGKERQRAPASKAPASKDDSARREPEETGTVKFFNRSKGYGFIIRENGEEVFVHQRSILGTGERKQRPVLREGQKVSFVVAHQEKGAQAEQVTALD